ncbi:MAG: chemotaxis protein [Rhodobiaceae bacterium]|nr:chemotaxis protein [Rhodobiaceae bacterium]
MSGSFVGVVVEGLVATLLVVTIVYCVRLNRKLERLRADETDMKNLVGDLIEATTNAEQAIQSLKGSASDWDRALGSRMRHAEKISGVLHEQMDAAELVVDRLRQICMAERDASAAQHATLTPMRSDTRDPADVAAARKRLGLGKMKFGSAQTDQAA